MRLDSIVKSLNKTALLVTLHLVCLGGAQQSVSEPTVYGFTAFPYDVTQQAQENIDTLIANHTNLYAIHRDDECLPWHALLERKAFPDWLERDWQAIKERIPKEHKVYVAITPTQSDRVSLAYACGNSEGSYAELPARLKDASLDSEVVRQAYLTYAKRVVAVFEPRFLVIGIEISELALKQPEQWQAYEALARATTAGLKQTFPDVRIGSEFVLQFLMLERVGTQVKPLIEDSDFLGISFYPYGSAYGESLGAPALPHPPAQWLEPLRWLSDYTTVPIGISETGYTTVPQRVNGVAFKGDERLQAAFLSDALAQSLKQNYLFFIWFVPVDFTKLYRAIPNFPDYGRIWVNSGLFDEDFVPKPAWKIWSEHFDAFSKR